MVWGQEFLAALPGKLAELLPAWGLASDAEITLLTLSENATFLARCGDKKFILRVHRPNYHSRTEILSELAWLAALNTQTDIPVPAALGTHRGELLLAVGEGHEQRHVVAFHFMTGAEPSAADAAAPWFKHLGAITAQLHQHARTWQMPASFQRKYWDIDMMVAEDGIWGNWRENTGISAEDATVIEQAIGLLRTRLETYGRNADVYGLVHADLRLANLLVDASQADKTTLKVIDFDDCGWCWYAYDFAAAISFYECDPAIPSLQKAWLQGYRSVAAFSSVDEAILPAMILLRRILLTAWLASHNETETATEFNTGYGAGTRALAERFLASGGLAVW